ncbi:uncharacterized protein [Diadema antillarum]|uniref:uncharacterized protein n=1 Tax=Diadema antillarum TaxID=105358 RepID=UPI003A8A6025
MAKELVINVQSSLAICDSLTDLLRRSFGPNAFQVLYTTSTGKVLVTSDGSTILRATNVAHPVGCWLISRVVSFHSQVGDCAKSYIFLIREVLEGICQEFGSMSKNMDRRSQHVSREEMHDLRRALSDMLHGCLPKQILPSLLQESFDASQVTLADFHNLGENVINTHLAGKLSPKQNKFFSSLLWNFIARSATNASILALRQAAQNIVDSFDVAVMEAAGLPIESSHIENGVILSRDAVTHLPRREGDAPCSVMIWGCDPFKAVPASVSTLSARTISGLVHTMQYVRGQAVKFVDLLVENNVRVVLCSECLSATSLSLLQRAFITVVHTVPLEELLRLSHDVNAQILYEVPTELQSAMIFSALDVKQVSVGSRRCTKVLLNTPPCVCHLILCAPTEGMCKVLSLSAMNSVKVINVWLASSQEDFNQCSDITTGPSKPSENPKDQVQKCSNSHSPMDCEMTEHRTGHGLSGGLAGTASGSCEERLDEKRGLLIPGGGSAELLASRLLYQKYRDHRDNQYQSLAEKIVANALLCIPRTLHQNSFAYGSRDSHSFVKILEQYFGSASRGLGIEGKAGQLSALGERGVWEPTMTRYSLWCSVIETVIELLKMDAIVPVLKIGSTQDATKLQDEDR